MKKFPCAVSLVAIALAACGCTSTTTEAQRLRREGDANRKTTEQHGKVEVVSETTKEAFGSRSTESQSASVSFGGK